MKKFIYLLMFMICFSAQARMGSLTTDQTGIAVPTFVQGVGSDLNDNNGIIGNAFKFNMPNATLANNSLILSIAYPFNASRTVALSDSCGDTWPSATVTAGTASNGNMNTKTYLLQNASACMHTMTVTFDTTIKPFQYTMAEFYNVGSADGSHSAANVGNTVALAGSYTPTTNNDANGGHLIWTYAISNDTIGTLVANEASAISKSGGISPSFMAANNISSIPSSSSFDVQTTNGVINPGFNFTQSSGTNFVVSSIAIKATSIGAAPAVGIRIKRLLHATLSSPQTGNNVFLFPVDGNLRIMTIGGGDDIDPINSVTDSNSNTYTGRASAGNSQIFDFFGTSANNNLTLTMNIPSSFAQITLHLFDVVGATSGFMNASGFNGSAPGSGSVLPNMPNHTPNANVSGLTIAQTGQGTAGPQFGYAAGAPAGAVFNNVFYTGITDQDRMDNADPFGHVYFSSNAAQNWNWNWNSACSGCAGSTSSATAASYK